MALASPVDLEESYAVGQVAVQHATAGVTDEMVTLERNPGPRYRCTTGLVELEKVANAEKLLPAGYINDEGNFVTPAFLDYARPLLGGPLPKYARLECFPVPKKL